MPAAPPRHTCSVPKAYCPRYVLGESGSGAAAAVNDGGGDENVHELTTSMLRRCFIAFSTATAEAEAEGAAAAATRRTEADEAWEHDFRISFLSWPRGPWKEFGQLLLWMG